MQPRVLIVDDESNIRRSLMRLMEAEGLPAVAACNSDEALGILHEQSIDVIIADERMPGMSGTHFLAIVRRRYPDTVRIVLSGQASLDAAVQAINEGEIFRFLTKPWNDDELIAVILEGLARRGRDGEEMAARVRSQRKRHIIEELEKEFPGIGKVDRDSDGSIIL